MNKIERNARDVYYTRGSINVTNNFTTTQSDQLNWLICLARTVNESILVFDQDLKLIYTNNAWGTFNSATPKNLDQVVNHVSAMYHNPGHLKNCMESTAYYMEPRTFVLHMVQGVDVICNSYPVVEQGVLAGVILAAWKDINDTKQSTTLTFTTT